MYSKPSPKKRVKLRCLTPIFLSMMILPLILLIFVACSGIGETEGALDHDDEVYQDLAMLYEDYEDEEEVLPAFMAAQAEPLPEDDKSPYPDAPFMWLITPPSGQTMYMFGSIHAGTRDMFPLSPVVMDAVRRSDYLAVEFFDTRFNSFRITPFSQIEPFAYTDGRTLYDDLPPELYQRLMAVLPEHEEVLSLVTSILFDDFIVILLKNDLCRARNRAASSMFRAKAEGDF